GTVQMFTISGSIIMGNVPIEGVTMTASPDGGTTTTDTRGKYSVQVPYGWTGEIIPKKEGINFNPPSQPYTNVTLNYMDGQPVPVRPPTPTPPVTTPTPPVTVPTPPVTVPTPPVTTPTPPVTVPTPPVTVPTPPVTVPTPPVTTPTPQEQAIADLQRQLAALTAQPGAAAPGAAARAPTGELLITNKFVDMDLVLDILPALAEQAGISIIPDETVQGLITADIQGVPLDTALDIVLAGTPYVVKKTPYYYLVCSAGVTASKFPVVSETKRLRLNYMTADAAVGLLSTAFRPYVQAEIGPAGTATATYTVVVTAPPALMNRIVADLRLIDRIPAQVLLDARIVVMEKGDLLNLGVEWSWPSMRAGLWGSDNYGGGDTTNEFGGNWPWGVQMGYSPDNTFTNALELTLNLLAENGEASILAKPQVLAQDGKQAQIRVLTEENFALIAPETSGLFLSRSEFTVIETGTTLTITPHIGDNNDITLQMAVEVSDSIPRGRGGELPVVTRRTAENNVTIQDGGTVALAGLTENRTRAADRRVPGLSNLPLIGGLFQNSDKDNATREIAVFVTARIVPKSQQTFEFPEPASIQQAPIPQVPTEDFRQSLRQGLSRRQLR
ncbi:MAG: type II secretion system protein GspD, partial [Planctomycetota bacterium]